MQQHLTTHCMCNCHTALGTKLQRGSSPTTLKTNQSDSNPAIANCHCSLGWVVFMLWIMGLWPQSPSSWKPASVVMTVCARRYAWPRCPELCFLERFFDSYFKDRRLRRCYRNSSDLNKPPPKWQHTLYAHSNCFFCLFFLLLSLMNRWCTFQLKKIALWHGGKKKKKDNWCASLKCRVHCCSIMYEAFHILRCCFWTSINIKNVSVISGKSYNPQRVVVTDKRLTGQEKRVNPTPQIRFFLSFFGHQNAICLTAWRCVSM